MKNTLKRIFQQREKILRLLHDDYRIVDENLTDDLIEILNKREHEIENIFSKVGGEKRKKNRHKVD